MRTLFLKSLFHPLARLVNMHRLHASHDRHEQLKKPNYLKKEVVLTKFQMSLEYVKKAS